MEPIEAAAVATALLGTAFDGDDDPTGVTADALLMTAGLTLAQAMTPAGRVAFVGALGTLLPPAARGRPLKARGEDGTD